MTLTEATEPDGPYRSVAELMRDPTSRTGDMLRMLGAMEDALESANADKAKLRQYLMPAKDETPPIRQRFWRSESKTEKPSSARKPA